MNNSQSEADKQERRWLALHLQGDGTAFAKLMQAYRKPIYSYLVRCGLDKNTRDDIFQDVFLKIHKSAKNYNPANPLSPWLFTIAVNTVRNHFRDQKPDHDHLSLCINEVPEFHLVDSGPSPDEQVDSQHCLQWLQQALLKLPEEQAQALSLAIIDGLKIKEVAKILEQPINTVKTHIRRARHNLIRSYKVKNKDNSALIKGASNE